MKKKIKRIAVIAMAVLLLISATANIYLLRMSTNIQNDKIWNINFPDANSRDTYYSIHHLKEAQNISKGSGIKVGIMDWGFGYSEHDGLYAGGKDFSTWKYHDENFQHANEHGFWMTQTLKEIAPDVEVYALGTYHPDNEAEWVDAMIEAIQWSLENDIDILTLSHQAISADHRERFDEAVDKAIEQGIVTTFIHYDNPNNILPWGIFNGGGDSSYQREADINIFQYDYNTLFMDNYGDMAGKEEFDTEYKSNLFMSASSMSVVTAGFVAILKSINDTLTPAQYKEILIQTSRPVEYESEKAEHVVDMGKAVQYMMENYK